MANYLYNGVKLPALPAFKYPNITINLSRYGGYDAVATENEAVWLSSYAQLASANGGQHIYHYDDGDTEWTENGERTETIISASGATLIWANHDVYYGQYVDGSYVATDELYLAASDPIPVSTPDPQSLTAGWLVGKKIAAMRGKV